MEESCKMEKYKDMEKNASNVSGANTKNVGRQGHKRLRQTAHIAQKLEVETEENQSDNLCILKAPRRHATNHLKIRQGRRVITRAEKSAEAAIKLIATQDIQAEKKKMQE